MKDAKIKMKFKKQKPTKSEYFEVEKLVKCKIKKSKRFFLVKWLNYPENENTWESEKSLRKNCKEMIIEFDREKKKISRVTSESGDFDLLSFHNSWAFSGYKETKTPITKPTEALLIKTEKKEEENLTIKTEFDEVQPVKVIGVVPGKHLEAGFIGMLFSDGEIRSFPYQEGREKWPQLLIDFFETRLYYVGWARGSEH